jgi:hypothetical protein
MGNDFWPVIEFALAEMQGQVKRKPTPDDLKRYFTGCGGPWTAFDNNTSWCGIFATYVLRRANLHVSWRMGHGIDGMTRVDGNEGLSIGDVAVRGAANNHHFIVLDDTPSGIIDAVEGNYGGVGNPWLHHGHNPKNNLSSVIYYYDLSDS